MGSWINAASSITRSPDTVNPRKASRCSADLKSISLPLLNSIVSSWEFADLTIPVFTIISVICLYNLLLCACVGSTTTLMHFPVMAYSIRSKAAKQLLPTCLLLFTTNTLPVPPAICTSSYTGCCQGSSAGKTICITGRKLLSARPPGCSCLS